MGLIVMITILTNLKTICVYKNYKSNKTIFVNFHVQRLSYRMERGYVHLEVRINRNN